MVEPLVNRALAGFLGGVIANHIWRGHVSR
jgi:hypothetical protein